jgi:diadenosine tetraphosphatase ApaH/serine/threonine PP2A family protein phosphatase
MFVEGADKALDITSLESIRTGRKQVVNVGSVGQPRDKDERACYVVYRRNEADVWWRRMPYDIAAAQQAIVDAGLPVKYAHRLSLGN